MTPRPLVLLTNDDGYDAPGLEHLRRAVEPLADTLIVAPLEQRSAISHAVSIRVKLGYRVIEKEGRVWGHALAGMPADCVKLGVTRLAPRRPDLVISGINPGANIGNNILYSGTVGAAREAAMLGLPALAVSQEKDFANEGLTQHFESAARFVHDFLPRVLEHGMPPGVILNCNLPNLPPGEIGGIEVTRQGRSRYLDDLAPGPDGEEPHYCNIGNLLHPPEDPEEDEDHIALERGNISVTPLHFDLTCSTTMRALHEWLG